MLMRAATVVQVLHGLYYVLLQLLVVAVITFTGSFTFYCKFYCAFYCSCDPSFTTSNNKKLAEKSRPRRRDDVVRVTE